MSATAFQRMRREAAAKKTAQSQKEVEKTPDTQLSEVEEENTENTEVEEENTEDEEEKTLTDMTVDELKEYAEKNNIDIGKATSKAGILEKIKVAEKTE